MISCLTFKQNVTKREIIPFLNSILFVYSLETAGFGREGKKTYLVVMFTFICYEWYRTLRYGRMRFHVMGKRNKSVIG